MSLCGNRAGCFGTPSRKGCGYMDKNVEYYLSRGFDRKMAEYFTAGRRRIEAVTANADRTLTLRFDNGELRRFDMAPLIRTGTVFAFLEAADAFQRVYLDDDRCVSWDIDPGVDSRRVWRNKVDLSPDVCYVDSVPIAGGAAHG